MWVFTEVAQWFESQRYRSSSMLDEWVEQSGYHQGAMIAAAGTKSLMSFGAGFVDLLRLGDGVASGTWKGVGTDALRFVAIFPVGQSFSLLKSARGVSAARFIADVPGRHCFWVASAKALRQIGHKINGRLLVSVDDLAAALGMPAHRFWPVTDLHAGVAYLQRLGVKAGPIVSVSNIDEVAALVPRDGSVMIFSVYIVKAGYVSGKHALYAFRNSFGQMRFMDRSVGGTTKLGQQGIYRSYSQLFPKYKAEQLIPYEAVLLRNTFAKTFAHDSVRLAIPILAVIAQEQ